MRRLLYFAVYGFTLILVVLALWLFGWAMPFDRRTRMASLWPGTMSTAWLMLATGIEVKTSGLTNLPPTPYIAVCNHQSEWETLYLARALRPASIVMKESLLKIPVYGWGQRLLKPITIDRSSPKASIKAILKQGTRRIQEGCNLLIFPEGTRVAAGSINKYSRTAFMLAVQTGAPIVPIVQNSGDCWKKGKFQKGTISIEIGKPVYPKEYSAKQLATLVERWSEEAYANLQQ